ncbi:putative chch domain protein [Lyophyllum shimeji]|uniref:Chch domain protein n=1 Tax=Lyophyllum shimeji TaxID=47721 RepID=A0A9P3PSS5_LYOSH|nr:putative chch domain protein [Lyophyllum shimeji]
MPRQSRGRSTSSSRAAPRAAPAPAPAQTRGAHTAAAPAGYAAPHAPAPPANAPSAAATSSQQPGMLAQMAATAGSVAVGSTIGHGLSSMLFGGSSHAPAEAQAAPVQQQQQQFQAAPSCEVQAKDFTKCLEKADLPSCTWYLEQLKACQAAAAPY